MSRWIDADALKDKLQQHHDFYVMAWGGFGKMPIGEKKRVDEITNCIAEVVNAPTIKPKRGEWVKRTHNTLIAQVNFAYCSECGQPIMHEHTRSLWSFCPNCGADMRERESE